MTLVAEAPPNMLALARRLVITAQIFGTMIQLAVIASMWGRPQVAGVLFGLWVAAAGANIAIPALLTPRLGLDREEDVRALVNLALHLPVGILCSWNFASWLLVPFLAALATTPSVRRTLQRAVLLLTAFVTSAMLTGAHWTDAAAFSGIGLFVHFLISAYLELANNLLRDRLQAILDLQAAQQLAIAQEKLASIGQIAAGVAHEINNPMCFITSNVRDLLDELRHTPDLPPNLVEYRDSAMPDTIDGIARINSIVDDLRKFARGEPEHQIEFDLTTEVSAAVRMARTQLRPGQRLHLEMPPALRFRGMPRQLCQVVLNLLVNGLQSLGPEGEVRVQVTEQDHTIEISVADDGVGMSPETREKLFQPFFTTKGPRQGVGLGLAVAHSMVHAHGGRIDVESELGSGSKFRLTLPRPEALEPGREARRPRALG